MRGNLIKSIKIVPSLPEALFKRVAAGSFELDISLLELLTGQGWDFLRIADIRRLRLLFGFSHFLFFLRDFDRQLLTTLSIKLFVLQHSGWPRTLKLCFLSQFRTSYLDQRLWGGIADKSPKVTGGAGLVAACWMPHCCFFGYYLFPAMDCTSTAHKYKYKYK